MLPWTDLLESVFLPLGISLVAACVFVLLWLARDRPGANKGNKAFYSGARHSLSWKRKVFVGLGFQLGFMLLFFLFSVDFDRQGIHTFHAVLLYSALFILIFAGVTAGIICFLFKHDLLLLFVVFGLSSGFVAACLGMILYDMYVSTERHVMEGKHFVGVSPLAHAQGFRDAGTVEFIPKALIDQSKAIGYKHGSTYCAAPIVTETAGEVPIQFWAVGMNCCRSRASFSCGTYQSNPLFGYVILPPILPPSADWPWQTEYEKYYRAVKMGSADFQTNMQPVLVKLRDAPDPSMTLFNMSCGDKNLILHVDKKKREDLLMDEGDYKKYVPAKGDGDWYNIMVSHVDRYWYLSTTANGKLYFALRDNLDGFQRWTISPGGTIRSLKDTSKGDYLGCDGKMTKQIPSEDREKWRFPGWRFGEQEDAGWGSSAIIFFGSGTAALWFFIFSIMHALVVLSLLALVPHPLKKTRAPDAPKDIATTSYNTFPPTTAAQDQL